MNTRYQVHRFPNGLRLAVAAMPEKTSVSVGLWVGVGARHEPESLNGASHFIEHMLFKGTRRRSARDISAAIEGRGGYLNAFTSEEHTCFFARTRHDQFTDVFAVLEDMLLHSVFAPGEIVKEREVIKEELAMYLDQPQHRVEELLNAIQWPGHPLGRPITGTPASLDALFREQLTGFYRERYVAPAVVVAVAGRIRLSDCLRAAGRLAARMRRGPRRPFAPVSGMPAGPVVRGDRMDTEQTQLALGLRTCPRHDDRRFALRLLNVLVGENMSSRLFQALREDTGLAYHVASSLSFFADDGDLVIAAGLDPERLLRALRLTVTELRRLKRHGPGRAELRRAKDYVMGHVDLGLENTETQMMWLGEQMLGYDRLFPPAVLKRRVAGVTAAEIRRVACDFFRPERLSLALVSAQGPSREVRRVLAAL